jgi:hypothetical protein
VTDETSLERERIGLRHALILGLSQRPLDVPGWLAGDNARAGRLALVAALGLRSRFDHPAPPPHLQRAGLAHEPARLVSREARAALRRIYGVKKRVVLLPITLRIVDALAERDLRLHPFDYPALAQLLATNDAALDRNARLFQALARSGDNAVAAEDIDERNWTDFKAAERAAYLRGRRHADPKAARELLAAAIGSETAAVRGQLLEAMAVALSADDVEFLRSLGTDRADSVRTLARRLTARVAGTSEFEERMSTAHERLEVKSAGIIGRRKVLMAKLPKGLAETKVEAWLDDSFAGVSTTLLAKRLDLRLEQLVEALADERLRALFFANALALGELTTVRAIAATLETAEGRRIAAASRAALASLEPAHRAEMWDAFRPALAAASLEERCAFAAELYEILRVPPRSAAMSPTETARPWKRWLDAVQSAPDAAQPEIPELLVAFADAADRDEWRARLADLSPALASTALALADLLDALDLQSKPKT